ncbi:hypothetical protein RFI_08862, partial [Reticulomyxa filosa]
KILRTKVSRERYSIEFGKILKGHYVSVALDAIVELGLADILFELPNQCISFFFFKKKKKKKNYTFSSIPTNSLISYIFNTYLFFLIVPDGFHFASALMTGVKIASEMEKLIHEEYEKMAKETHKKTEEKQENTNVPKLHLSSLKKIKHELLFASFLYPFRDVKYTTAKNRTEEIVKYFCLESISGLGKDLAKKVVDFHKTVELFLQSITCENDNETKRFAGSPQQSQFVGSALRIAKDEWRYGVMLTKSVLRQQNANTRMLEELEEWTITKSLLNECWKWKPLYNGNDVRQEFPVFENKQNIKSLGIVLDELVLWRLSDPTADKEKAKHFVAEWIKQNLGSK